MLQDVVVLRSLASSWRCVPVKGARTASRRIDHGNEGRRSTYISNGPGVVARMLVRTTPRFTDLCLELQEFPRGVRSGSRWSDPNRLWPIPS